MKHSAKNAFKVTLSAYIMVKQVEAYTVCHIGRKLFLIIAFD